MTKTKLLNSNDKLKIFIVSIFVASLICLTPAFADIEGIIYSMLSTIIGFIANAIVLLVQWFIMFLLAAMDFDVSTLNVKPTDSLDGSVVMFRGFIRMSGLIRTFAVSIAAFAVLWQLISSMISPATGTKQNSSVGNIITRALICIPLAYIIQDLMFIFLRQIQLIYQAMMSAATKDNLLFKVVSLTAMSDVFDENIKNSTTLSGTLDLAFSGALFSLISLVATAIFLVLILYNLLKLILEVAQRFVLLIMYCFLSPLAAGRGVLGDGSILKKTIGSFMSTCVLWVLSAWAVRAAFGMLNYCGLAVMDGVQATFTWGLLTFSFIRVAQQMDDLFNLIGVTNLKLSGSLIEDVMMLGRTFNFNKSIPRLAGNAAGAVAGGVAAVGKMAGMPVDPKKTFSMTKNAVLHPVAATKAHFANKRAAEVMGSSTTKTSNDAKPNISNVKEEVTNTGASLNSETPKPQTGVVAGVISPPSNQAETKEVVAPVKPSNIFADESLTDDIKNEWADKVNSYEGIGDKIDPNNILGVNTNSGQVNYISEEDGVAKLQSFNTNTGVHKIFTDPERNTTYTMVKEGHKPAIWDVDRDGNITVNGFDVGLNGKIYYLTKEFENNPSDEKFSSARAQMGCDSLDDASGWRGEFGVPYAGTVDIQKGRFTEGMDSNYDTGSVFGSDGEYGFQAHHVGGGTVFKVVVDKQNDNSVEVAKEYFKGSHKKILNDPKYQK